MNYGLFFIIAMAIFIGWVGGELTIKHPPQIQGLIVTILGGVVALIGAIITFMGLTGKI
jgi:hypothetical protein